MAANSSYAVISGIVNDVYNSKPSRPIPSSDKMQQLFPLDTSKTPGDSLKTSVTTSAAHGGTFGGADSDAYTLSTPIAETNVKMSVKLCSYAAKGILSQDIIDRASKGTTRSVVDAVKFKIKEMSDTASFFLDVSCIHGRSGIGSILARTNDSGGTQTFSLQARTWSTAMWKKMLGGMVYIYGGAASDTAKTATGATVASFNASAHTITLTGVEAELDTVAADVANYPVIYPMGGYNTAMFEGLGVICGSTSSTIHGLSQSTYPNWASSYVDASSERISLDLVETAVAQLADQGCTDDLVAIMAHSTAATLKSDLAKRESKKPGSTRFDLSTNTVGFEDNDLLFSTYMYAKPGEVLIVPQKNVLYRIGVEPSFVELSKGQYIQDCETINGGYLKIRWNQALVCENPSWTCKIKNIGLATV